MRGLSTTLLGISNIAVLDLMKYRLLFETLFE